MCLLHARGRKTSVLALEHFRLQTQQKAVPNPLVFKSLPFGLEAYGAIRYHCFVAWGNSSELQFVSSLKWGDVSSGCEVPMMWCCCCTETGVPNEQ